MKQDFITLGFTGTEYLDKEIVMGLLIPFLGTAAGAALVFLLRDKLSCAVQRGLTGFAAGVMMAASIWSLLIPAIEKSAGMGKLSFMPAAAGFLMGIGIFLLLDYLIPHTRLSGTEKEGPEVELSRTSMMVLAVVLHNIPEGMAVGAVYAGILKGDPTVTLSGAMALSIGIAIQNFPEGAIISLPMRASGKSRIKSFGHGLFSGVAELTGALITLAASAIFVPAMPYLLSFAAGAMVYVVVDELIPEISKKGSYKLGTLTFVFGFVLMMSLDVALG